MRDVVTIIKYKETDRLKETGHKYKVYNAYVISHHTTATQVKLLDAFVNEQLLGEKRVAAGQPINAHSYIHVLFSL